MNNEYIKKPWGQYCILFEESGIWIKKIILNPHSRLSLQKHFKRHESWTISEGKGFVVVGDKKMAVEKFSVIDIPVEVPHRIENPNDDRLVFIEVAHGEELLEDDIVRLQDDYNR